MRSSALFQTESKHQEVSAPVFKKEAGASVKSNDAASYGSFKGVGHSFGKVKVNSNGRLPSPPVRLQAKLMINQPDDLYEQEADRVAEQVVSNEPQKQQAYAYDGGLPRVGKDQGSDEQLQLKSVQESDAGAATVPPSVEEVLSSSSQPLDPTTLDFMESRFGYDFSKVRVHTDARAVNSARVMGARAYTVGSDVVFGSRQYAPRTIEGKRLLAHELTHVVQQQTAAPTQNNLLQLQEVEDTWTPPTAGVVQAWLYNQVDNWHTGATQALSHFRDAVLEESSVGFWLQLSGNVIWAVGAIFPPAGAVASGLTGVAIATIGVRVQEHQAQQEYQRVQDIYDDLLAGMNQARSQMDARVIAEANRVMALGAFQTAIAQRDTTAWQRLVRTEAGVPQADDVNRVSHSVESNLYNQYLRERGAWVEHDIFQVPSPHHPGTESEFRNFFPQRIPERVRNRLNRIGVDWRRIDELPIPHRHRDMSRLQGTVGAIEYWNYEENTDFPPSWTEEDKREFLSKVPSYLSTRRSGVTH